MRKILLTLIVLATVFSFSYSQTIPSGDMESWKQTGSYFEPVGWMTANQLASFGGITVFKETTDVHGGATAARMETVQGSFTFPGAMVAGNASFGLGGVTPTGGFPCASRVKSLTGWYKYSPGAGDSCLIQAWLFRRNPVTHARDTVATMSFKWGDSVKVYTQFSVDFKYNTTSAGGETPDSALILISASEILTAAKLGSVLLIDDLAFSGTVASVDNIALNKAKVSVYPNPAVSFVEFKVDNRQVSKIIIYDILGKKIRTQNVENAVVPIPTADMQNGMYFYQLTGKAGEVISTGKFSVRK